MLLLEVYKLLHPKNHMKLARACAEKATEIAFDSKKDYDTLEWTVLDLYNETPPSTPQKRVLAAVAAKGRSTKRQKVLTITISLPSMIRL